MALAPEKSACLLRSKETDKAAVRACTPARVLQEGRLGGRASKMLGGKGFEQLGPEMGRPDPVVKGSPCSMQGVVQ